MSILTSRATKPPADAYAALGAAVAAAYGWPAGIADDDAPRALLALNGG